jgi:dTDP-4-amino-4,6-dideoxygalactose transaminase
MITGITSFGIEQAKNLVKFFVGKPLTYPSLGSMTLDQDDVRIAKTWLKNKVRWNDDSLVVKYEKMFAEWNGSKHAFVFMGGRVALSACIYALNLQPGDEVIVPGYTCVVVPNAFQFADIQIKFCDIELDTYGLDASLIEEKIGPQTKAIMLHHLYGLVCRDYEKIINIANKHNLKVIEDCAHSTGAKYKGRNVGNYGDVAFYSSEQSKVFNTIQGGVAVTNNEFIADKIRYYYQKASRPDEAWVEKQLSNVILNYFQYKHPQRWWMGDVMRYQYKKMHLVSTTHEEECGIQPLHYGRRMPAPIAAIGINQLKKIDRYNSLRRKNALQWDSWCENNGYEKPLIINDSVPVYLRYPLMVSPEKKRNTSWVIDEIGVRAGVWFRSNIHPVNRSVNGCPNADRAVQRCINLPGLIE